MEELFKARKEKLNLFKSIRNKMQDKKRIDVPDGLYTKCDSCGESILSEDLKESYYVCPKCGAHLKMRAYTRLNLLYDGVCQVLSEKRLLEQLNMRQNANVQSLFLQLLGELECKRELFH